MFSAFLIAQIADGYQFKLSYAFLFCAVMGWLAGRIKSAIALGAYVGFSILLAHFIIATYSINYSTDRFFPSLWGPLDLLLMAMMWSSPVLVLIAEAFDNKIAKAFEVRLFKALVILKTTQVIPTGLKIVPLSKNISKLANQIYLSATGSRAPPFHVV